MRLFQALLVVSLASVTVANAAVVNAANCSSAAVQAAIDSALSGDIVMIPNGSCTWTTGVTIIGKGLILRGLIPGGVTIVNNVTTRPAIDIEEDNEYHTQVSHLTIVGTESFPENAAIDVATNASGMGLPVLIHDIVFTNSRAIRMNTNHGVIYSNTMNDNGGIRDFVQCTPAGYVMDSWTASSTMGTADTLGQSNVYVEDNVITHSRAQSIDIAAGCRIVIRNNIFDHSALSSHGADTEPVGLRHFELYDNKFIWVDRGDATTVDLGYFFFLRGGTGVITNNEGLRDMSSSEWGFKPGLRMTVMNLQRNGGPNPCWGAGTPETEYPAPRQIGMGYFDGSGKDGLGRTVDGGTDGTDGTYVGEPEPLYIWNQPGLIPIVQDYGLEGQQDSCTGAGPFDLSTNYIVQGRDYFFSADTPKPGWTRYAYPHPLRSRGPGAPRNPRIVQ